MHVIFYIDILLFIFGDVQNWAEVIEKDVREIAMTLEFVHKGLSREIVIG